MTNIIRHPIKILCAMNDWNFLMQRIDTFEKLVYGELKKILTQTTTTNGRVNNAEQDIREHTQAMKELTEQLQKLKDTANVVKGRNTVLIIIGSSLFTVLMALFAWFLSRH